MPARSTNPDSCSTGPALWDTEKRRSTGKKALAYRGKSGKNTGNALLALGLGVVLYLPIEVVNRNGV